MGGTPWDFLHRTRAASSVTEAASHGVSNHEPEAKQMYPCCPGWHQLATLARPSEVGVHGFAQRWLAEAGSPLSLITLLYKRPSGGSETTLVKERCVAASGHVARLALDKVLGLSVRPQLARLASSVAKLR
ncbi:unnamed protein product [Symbiodinium natans]|uniref:Uncharacterized protein n=1 Tax=Symbiodinium natans TaxID=878477 RepID=A0A812PJ97_9DINO|nr:unnamed protein product [Symbiodinium natans]